MNDAFLKFFLSSETISSEVLCVPKVMSVFKVLTELLYMATPALFCPQNTLELT